MLQFTPVKLILFLTDTNINPNPNTLLGAVAAAVESVTGPVTARNLATADAPRTGNLEKLSISFKRSERIEVH